MALTRKVAVVKCSRRPLELELLSSMVMFEGVVMRWVDVMLGIAVNSSKAGGKGVGRAYS